MGLASRVHSVNSRVIGLTSRVNANKFSKI